MPAFGRRARHRCAPLDRPGFTSCIPKSMHCACPHFLLFGALPEFCPVCATGAALSIDANARVFSAAAGSGLTCNIHGPAGGAFLNVACIGPAPIRSVGQVGRTLRVLVAAFWLLASWSHRSSSALLGPTSQSYVCMGVYRMVSPTIDTFSDSALCGAWLHLAHRRRYRRYLGRRTQSTQCPILEGCGRCVP